MHWTEDIKFNAIVQHWTTKLGCGGKELIYYYAKNYNVTFQFTKPKKAELQMIYKWYEIKY